MMISKIINRKNYPELDTILWDIQTEAISPELAFQMYEKRWCYIDQNRLIKEEQLLIDNLIKVIGHGLFLPS